MAVRAGQHPASSSQPGTRGQQGQRCGRTEPDGFDVVLGDQPAHPDIDRWTRQHHRAGMAHHPVTGSTGCVVEGVGAFPLRCIHCHRMRSGADQPTDELPQIGLDAPASGWKVVSYQQDPAHLGQASGSTLREQTQSRPKSPVSG